MSIASAISAALKTYTIPLLAIAGMGMAAFTVVKSARPSLPAPPLSEPAKTPYAHSVSGAGLIEPSTQNIAIGTAVPGVVSRVLVKAGDTVEAGATLFAIDDREIRAALASREATLEVRRAGHLTAQARLESLRQLPRAETIPPMEAKVAEARAALSDAESQLAKWDAVEDKRALSQDLFNQRRQAVQVARARVASVEAELALLKAGAFKPELDAAAAQVTEAQAQIASAQADVEAARIEVARREIRSPVAGRVLQVNIRPGEFAPAGVVQTPLLIVGGVTPMHVRCDVDENEAWRVKEGSPAVAFLRGNSSIKTPLKFVRCEPYIVPKKSLTGDSAERVDTRVLQVIFAIEGDTFSAYVGQQVDVYIESAPREEAK